MQQERNVVGHTASTVRKQGKMMLTVGFLSLIQSRTPAGTMALPMDEVGLPSSVYPIYITVH